MSVAVDAPVASTSAAPPPLGVTCAGQHVLFRLPKKLVRAVKLTPGTTAVLGKLGSVPVDGLIGLHYGVTYELQADSTLVAATVQLQLEPTDDDAATNEHIASLGQQGLSADDIEALRNDGAQGRDIVMKQMTANSSFDKKTIYAKQKYIARKEAKYLKLLVPLPPTLPHLCEYAHDKSGTMFPLAQALRTDTLAQILSSANVRTGSRCLVVDDTTSALLTSAILSRLDGSGRLFLIADTDSDPPHVMMPYFNLSAEQRRPLRWLNWASIQPEWTPTEEVGDGEETMRAEAGNPKSKARAERKVERLAALQTDREEFFAGEFDALIIASTYDLASVVQHLTPKLAGSGQLVATSSVVQPLSALTSYLRDSKDYIAPSLTEPTLRRYQVLPGRTHPDMNGMVHGGYILHAYRILATNETFTRPDRPVKVKGKRKRAEEDSTA